jgi:two-component system response regulator HydG
VKLLRVLEEKEIERVGDHKPIAVDVRIISATNKDLDALIAQNLFREDLYFRINVFPLSCPALAERYEDIPLLVQNFIEQNTKMGRKKIVGLTPEALETLYTYHWPGNVRELRNAIEYAFVLCSGSWIGKEHLPPKITAGGKKTSPSHRPNAASWEKERIRLINALQQVGGNQTEAARILGVSRVTVWKRIKKYDIHLESDLN